MLSPPVELDGKSRAEAGMIGGIYRQALRDRVHRFNCAGPDGMKDHWTCSLPPCLSDDLAVELAQIVKAGHNRERDEHADDA